MNARLLRIADRLRESYWFVPSLMALAAVLLAGGMIALDSYEGSAWMDRFAWLYASRPNGARQVLSSIGSSMITVSGTVFSVTIAAVVYASGQYGPRLLSNFMSDRGNQITLGTFIATFLYCLVVLRTIRSPEESGGVGFVPNLALLVAVLLAICSIAVLIFFIHHVPKKLHINSVIEEVGERLLRQVGQRFPRFIGAQPAERDEPAANIPEALARRPSAEHSKELRPIASEGTGYIQTIDDGRLIEQARAHDLVLRLQYRPGDFVHVGRVLVEAWPAERCGDEVVEAIQEAFGIGAKRTALQDLRFLIDELVEIAARALSPGVNDPFTAVTCLDWLGAALSDLAGREIPSPLRKDRDGGLRVIAYPQPFESFLDRSFGVLARYCASDMVAALRYLGALGEVALACGRPDRRQAAAGYIDKLDELTGDALSGFNSKRVSERAAEVRRALSDPGYRRHLRESAAWLGGTA